MDKDYLERIILDQSEDLKQIDLGLPRDKLLDLDTQIKSKINIIITGVRRCGKSTLLLQIMNKYYKNKFYYLRFADERLSDIKIDDYQKIYEIFQSNFNMNNIFFFDEIQGKPNWDKFVNRLYETGNKFYITGSNSELLSKEISTYLTGRHLDVELYPFSFKEYLNFKKINLDYRYSKNLIKIEKELNNYIKIGGFPQVVVENNLVLLEEIYEDIINKDILLRYNLNDVAIFKKIALFLISNISKEFSYNSIKKMYDIGNSDTVRNYVYYLKNAYLLFELPKYDYSLKKQESYSKKIYAIDTGLINKLAFSFSENIGRLYENLVFIELKRRNKRIYFWKDKSNYEIDFIILEKNKVTSLIQIVYDLSDLQTKEREIRGLISGLKEFKLKEGIIITKDLDKKEKIDNLTIKYIPLWKWLLE
ncbi:MAG: ATP-binding protein [Candidatus ainarchaeum sp.]|nr:ATP-binding protein [Candidatus ainarchaeum sp.]